MLRGCAVVKGRWPDNATYSPNDGALFLAFNHNSTKGQPLPSIPSSVPAEPHLTNAPTTVQRKAEAAEKSATMVGFARALGTSMKRASAEVNIPVWRLELIEAGTVAPFPGEAARLSKRFGIDADQLRLPPTDENLATWRRRF